MWASALAFLGSFLAFLLEPLLAKSLLPRFGGSASVWTTTMVFFQVALVGGYALAGLAARLGRRRRELGAFAALGLIAAALGPGRPLSVSLDDPLGGLLWELCARALLPSLVLYAGSILVQRWRSAAVSEERRYALYAASNLGSLVGLLAFPLVLEPLAPLGPLFVAWQVGLAIYVLGLVGESWKQGAEITAPALPRTSLRTQARWAWPALLGSALLGTVTRALTADLAPVPLMWVVPLTVYLLTFVVAFAGRGEGALRLARLLVVALSGALVWAYALEVTEPAWGLVIVALAQLGSACLVLHVSLYASRPGPLELPRFYVAIALGGALGGIAATIAPPLLTDTTLEYPLILAAVVASMGVGRPSPRAVWGAGALAVALALGLPWLLTEPGELGRIGAEALSRSLALVAVGLVFRRWPMAIASGFLAVGTIHALSGFGGVDILARERTFYGHHLVYADPDHAWHHLRHGSTLHGLEAQTPNGGREPLAYYTRTGPAGAVFRTLSSSASVGLVGLGAGALATYARPGDHYTFLELDPAVARIARDPSLFRHLSSSAAPIEVVLGDARLTLADQADASFSLIVLDAFSSDAIPTHLLTTEALSLYRRKLRPEGWILVHVSNRFLDLARVIPATAATVGLDAWLGDEPDHLVPEAARRAGKFPSRWVLLVPRGDPRTALLQDPHWAPLPSRGRPWTDAWTPLTEAW